jgi:hypothetical protein
MIEKVHTADQRSKVVLAICACHAREKMCRLCTVPKDFDRGGVREGTDFDQFGQRRMVGLEMGGDYLKRISVHQNTVAA